MGLDKAVTSGDPRVIPVTEENATILVVDDNPLIVNVLKSLFSAQEYNVYSSCNGREATELLKKKSIDVIVCDVMMPEMDGYAFHQSVRSDPQYAHIPFVFLTALGSHGEINKGRETGADDYVVKPFDPKDLLAIVRGKVVRSRNLKNLSEARYEAYRRRVIHTLSHEFRTPLVAINTGAELLMEQEGQLDPSKAASLMEAIRRGGQRLESLVTDFMLMQQIEAGIAQNMYRDRVKAHDISELVENYLASRNEWLMSLGFEVRFESAAAGLQVYVYEPQIDDILGRLLSNSVKFSRERKVIEVAVYPRAGEVVVEVRDRGIGIDVHRLREAVDAFGQIDRDRLEQQGGGLGLAIANRYAKINGAVLEFENRADGGAVVSLVLSQLK
ncbi:MAG: hybrid sensor histidine kinase/response regulator [Deltaproteobacteria bacterium]|nr:hybrid sensor histidine kinase/response regulator [Deltaproteobacteria bacterium]